MCYLSKIVYIYLAISHINSYLADQYSIHCTPGPIGKTKQNETKKTTALYWCQHGCFSDKVSDVSEDRIESSHSNFIFFFEVTSILWNF